MKELFRRSWKDFIAIVVSGFFAERLLDLLGWPNNFISYTGAFMVIFFLTAILITLVELLVKKMRK